ncbi:MAG: flagellar motor protein MotB [Elusimicrobia bacterium]|nr:flagellar motor protein MotB [Elusimicrobiota bacterium]
MPLKPPRGFIDESDPRVSQIGHPAPPWLINYADLMTELVCFFIILYALSAALNKNVQQAKQQLEQIMKEGKVAGEVKMTKDGLRVTFEEKGEMAFFHSGKAELTPGLIKILGEVAPTLQGLAKEFDILVEGHTDNVPIHTAQFDSNWELSTARATKVVHHMIDNLKFSPVRLAAVGYGEYKPVAPGDTDENRAKNRRVVFFVKTTPEKFAKEEKKEK